MFRLPGGATTCRRQRHLRTVRSREEAHRRQNLVHCMRRWVLLKYKWGGDSLPRLPDWQVVGGPGKAAGGPSSPGRLSALSVFL